MKPKIEREYYESGAVSYEEWCVKGQRHREDGPAYISYYDSGAVRYEEWYVKGQLHNTSSPAYMYYYSSGAVRYKQWFVKGKRLDDNEIKELKWKINFDKEVMEVLR